METTALRMLVFYARLERILSTPNAANDKSPIKPNSGMVLAVCGNAAVGGASAGSATGVSTLSAV
jgi:hypothetical protein